MSFICVNLPSSINYFMFRMRDLLMTCFAWYVCINMLAFFETNACIETKTKGLTRKHCYRFHVLGRCMDPKCGYKVRLSCCYLSLSFGCQGIATNPVSSFYYYLSTTLKRVPSNLPSKATGTMDKHLPQLPPRLTRFLLVLASLRWMLVA